jgi:hypothetical protein
VLYRDRGLKIDWNQIHLCEVDAFGIAGIWENWKDPASGRMGSDLCNHHHRCQ